MRKGFVVPYADSRDFAELAAHGEEHGWDGIFTWEALWGVDAWVSLGAAAMRTERIRLGTMLTPAARFRPWDLATRVGTVDRLSGGRVSLSVGLGALHDGWVAFEADEGRRTRAEKLDDVLAIYGGLMQGQPFSYEGRHYTARPTDFMLPDAPVQKPHPPVWVVGALVVGSERQRSLERAARWNGLLPQFVDGDRRGAATDPEQLAEILGVVRRLREGLGLGMDDYDVVVEGDVVGSPDEQTGSFPNWEAAGATWWVEGWWNVERGPEGLAEVRRRVAAGPPA